MNGMLRVLQHWLDGAEALAAHIPALAGRLAAGSWPAIALAAALGIALLVAGVRLRRVVASAAALAVGYGAGIALAAPLGVEPLLAAWPAALTLALSALVSPVVYPAALGAVAGALLGAQVPIAGHPTLGAVLLAAALAVATVLLRRGVLATTSAVTGATLVAVAILAVGRRWGALGILRERPVLLAGLALLLAVAGIALQLGAPVDRGAVAGHAAPARVRTRRPLES